jgi:integrase
MGVNGGLAYPRSRESATPCGRYIRTNQHLSVRCRLPGAHSVPGLRRRNAACQRHAQTKGAAERALRVALRDRVHVGAEAEITPDTKIAGLAETWFAEISTQDRSPGTLRAYRDRLDRQIIPALGNLRVRELTTGVVDRHLRAIRDKHGASLAKLCRTVLSGMAGLATRHDALEHNPVRDAGRISPGKPKRVPRALSVAETRELRAWLSNNDKARERDLPDLVDMLLATGLRVGEALAVTWDAVDLAAGTVEVRGTVIRVKGRGLVIKPAPKTRAGFRTLVLPSWAVEMLRLRPSAGRIKRCSARSWAGYVTATM